MTEIEAVRASQGEVHLPVAVMELLDEVCAGRDRGGSFYAPADPAPADRWLDTSVERRKVWTGEWWEREGVRDAAQRPVIEFPGYEGDRP